MPKGESLSDIEATPGSLNAVSLPPRFTLRQLAYFVAAGETRSVTVAAARVNISPPSISSAIAQLEAEFAVQLFIRHHAQGLSLTSAGHQLLIAAQHLLRQSDELTDIASEISSAVSGQLHIASFRTFAPLIIPELCRAFLEKFPAVKISVTEGDEVMLSNLVKRGDVSLALTYKINMPAELSFETLAELPSYILLPGNHPLAARSSLRLTELVEMPFILLDMPLTREYFLAMFTREGLNPFVVASSENPETVRSYVACGFGYSLATARPKAKIASNGLPLAYVRLEGDFPVMQLGITSRSDLRRTRAMQAFEAHCREVIQGDELPGIARW